jgi:hypothetical protein
MRKAAAASWGLFAVLATWDALTSGAGELAGTLALCALAAAAAAPALQRAGGATSATRLWNWLGRRGNLACAGLLGTSHFFLKSPPGSSLVLSITYAVALLALVELIGWANSTARFREHVSPDAESAWVRAFAARFVPLAALSLGLGAVSVTLAVGLDGTWSALALAVGLVITIVMMARSAAHLA